MWSQRKPPAHVSTAWRSKQKLGLLLTFAKHCCVCQELLHKNLLIILSRVKVWLSIQAIELLLLHHLPSPCELVSRWFSLLGDVWFLWHVPNSSPGLKKNIVWVVLQKMGCVMVIRGAQLFLCLFHSNPKNPNHIKLCIQTAICILSDTLSIPNLSRAVVMIQTDTEGVIQINIQR